MLNTYKDCKASFCSSLSVSHLSKCTFLLFLLFLFYFSYLNAFSFISFSQISPFCFPLFVLFLSAPSLLSCFNLSSTRCRIQSHRSQFSKPQLGTFPPVSSHSTNSMHTHKQKEAHTFSSLQSLFHLQVWIDKFDDFLIVLIYERGEKKRNSGDWVIGSGNKNKQWGCFPRSFFPEWRLLSDHI